MKRIKQKKHANKRLFSMLLAAMVFTLLPITSYATSAIALSVIDSTADGKTYDGTTTAVAHVGTVSGIESGDDVVVTASAAFYDKNAENGKDVTITYSLTGNDAEKYTAPANSITVADIDPKQLFVSDSTADNKTYDGTTAAQANVGTVTGKVAGDDVTVTIASATFADSEVGSNKEVTIKYSLSGADAGNYAVPFDDTVTADITSQDTPKIELSVSGTTVDEKTYDGTTDAVVHRGTVSGISYGDDVRVTASAAFADKNAGNGKEVTITYSLTGTDAGKYTAPGNETTTADITKRPITIIVDDKSKVYGEEDPILTATITNFVAGDSLDYTLKRDEGESVGTYAIRAFEQGLDSNYDVTFVYGTFTITEAAGPIVPTEPAETTETTETTGTTETAEPEAVPTPTPKAGEVKVNNFVVSQKTVDNAKINVQPWYGYQFKSVFEKKEAKGADVTDYLNKCIAGGKELITFTPSGIITTSVIELGTALSKVNGKEKVKGLDLSSVAINENADLSNAFTGYTSLEIIDVSNWRVYNGTFEKAGLAPGSGHNIFYYNDLTNKEYINKLEALGWVGKHENLDLSNWIKVDPSFVEWAGLVEKKTFTYNAATAQAYIDYLTALGWTGINESAG